MINIFKRNFSQDVKHGIKIYNCKTKSKVPLQLKNPLYSSWYTCGPTVYDSAHVGHASTYVRIDILQRILRDYFGVNLVTCMNITNIDDKIIKKSAESGRNWKLIAKEYEAEFWEDLSSLNVKHPDIKLRVTDKIPEIIKFIEGIEKKGFTKIVDNSVHFKTSDYTNYAKLQNSVLEDPTAGDFALWKGAKPGEPSWETKWGNGRPGWHIECSTLATLVFGSHLDFHAGGIDLRFPHHENEEAQSCVYHSVDDWVTNWIHTGHLHLKGQSEKMSKSLKNTVSIRKLLQNYSSDQFRVACILSHYRSSIEFGPDLLTAADAILKKLRAFREDTSALILGLKACGQINEQDLVESFENCKKQVEVSLCDDFNTSKSMASMIDLMSLVSKSINNAQQEEANTAGCEKTIIQGILNYVNRMFETFGVGQQEKSNASNNLQLENLVDNIIKVRNEIRLKAKEEKNKDLFKVCDAIRDSLKESRIEIKDHGNLSSWNKIND